MDANTITAVSATVIAVVSLVVSVTEARATRKHNRQSIRPLLSFECRRQGGQEAGIRLYSSGLGPAIIKSTLLTVDGKVLGPWEAQVVNPLRDTFEIRPRFTSLRVGKTFQAGINEMLLAIDKYDPDVDARFWELISRRIKIQVRYESLYGGEGFEALFEGPYDIESRPTRHLDTGDKDGVTADDAHDGASRRGITQ